MTSSLLGPTWRRHPINTPICTVRAYTRISCTRHMLTCNVGSNAHSGTSPPSRSRVETRTNRHPWIPISLFALEGAYVLIVFYLMLSSLINFVVRAGGFVISSRLVTFVFTILIIQQLLWVRVRLNADNSDYCGSGRVVSYLLSKSSHSVFVSFGLFAKFKKMYFV